MQQPTEFAAIRFSTDDLPARDRLSIWYEVFGRSLVDVEMDSLSDNDFFSHAEFYAVAGIRIASCMSSPIVARRTGKLVADGNDNIGLYVKLSGTTTISHRGREITLHPGDATTILNAEKAEVIQSEGTWLGVTRPRHALSPFLVNQDDTAMRLIPARTPALRLLTSYVSAGRRELVGGSSELHSAFATHVLDLCAIAVGANRDGMEFSRRRGGRAARLTAIKADIARHLGQCNFGISDIASRQGITPRSVQLLFEREGLTFSEYVLNERLARAYLLLTDPLHAGSNISLLAQSAGFGDLSYFNRTFRRRYGSTPGEARDGALSTRMPDQETSGSTHRFDSQ